MSESAFARVRERVAQQRAARAAAKTDIDTLLRPCPASQPQLFVVPVRYALAEHALEHRACPMAEAYVSRPLAARRLRTGFVYVWHHQGPLQRYAVAGDGLLLEQPLLAPADLVNEGSLTGLALDKHEEAWMCFTEYPIGPAQCKRLSERAVREQHMRRIDLRKIANTLEAPHCPPFDDAEQIIGELEPAVCTRTKAVDHQRNGEANRQNANKLRQRLVTNPSDENVKAYSDAEVSYEEGRQASELSPEINAESPAPGEWSAVPWDSKDAARWTEKVHQQADPLYPVFACLDDELGLLRDINHEQEKLQADHQRWQQGHAIRLQTGGFIRSLLEESASEAAGFLSYRYREQNIQLSKAQGETLLQAHHQLAELFWEESTINQERGHRYSQKEADAELNRVWQKKSQCLQPVRAFIPPELHNEIEAVVREYRAESVENLSKRNGPEVEDYIDLSAMNTWLDETAPAHFEQLRTRQDLLLTDRGRLLYEHYRATWFIDHEHTPTWRWLNELAMACLSAQCDTQAGVEQYAAYVRSNSPGILRQLVYAWSPNLEGGLVVTSRMGELATALAMENREQAIAALHKVLAPISKAVLYELGSMSGPEESVFSLLLKRLGSAFLLLGKDSTETLHPAWASILVMARLSGDSAIRWVTEGNQRILRFVGGTGEALSEWTQRTGQAIGLGKVDAIRSPAMIKNSGGVLPLAVMVLNLLNAQRYLGQLQAVPRPDEQRIHDTAAAAAYAGAALTAVVDSQIRKGLGIKAINLGNSSFAVMTLFGAVIGGLSAYAALSEFASLQVQLGDTLSFDPWLQTRKYVAGGLVATYGLQALVGAAFTIKAIFGVISVEAAIAGYLLWMGPISVLIAGLGVLYLITWLFQKTPLQTFLSNCCWSKSRALKSAPIAQGLQHEELESLFSILYSPRLSFTSENHRITPINSHSGVSYVSTIDSLTIDLPCAQQDGIYLEIAMIGYSVDKEAIAGQNIGLVMRTQHPPKVWSDVVLDWITKSHCDWIPFPEGRGLRLSGKFSGSKDLTSPTKACVRIRYQTPLTALLGEKFFIGGESGITYTLSYEHGVIKLRNESNEILDNAKKCTLADGSQRSTYITPRIQL
ncbi:MAG: hypothetical protein RR517_25985 [Pseudomonas sp.]